MIPLRLPPTGIMAKYGKIQHVVLASQKALKEPFSEKRLGSFQYPT